MTPKESGNQRATLRRRVQKMTREELQEAFFKLIDHGIGSQVFGTQLMDAALQRRGYELCDNVRWAIGLKED